MLDLNSGLLFKRRLMAGDFFVLLVVPLRALADDRDVVREPLCTPTSGPEWARGLDGVLRGGTPDLRPADADARDSTRADCGRNFPATTGTPLLAPLTERPRGVADADCEALGWASATVASLDD